MWRPMVHVGNQMAYTCTKLRVKTSSSQMIAMHSTGLMTKFDVSFRYFAWCLSNAKPRRNFAHLQPVG